MEKVLYLDGTFFSPSPSVLPGNSFEELDGVFVPTTERFDDERLEEDPLGTAIVEMVANLCGLAHLDGRRRRVSCAMEDNFLDW